MTEAASTGRTTLRDRVEALALAGERPAVIAAALATTPAYAQKVMSAMRKAGTLSPGQHAGAGSKTGYATKPCAHCGVTMTETQHEGPAAFAARRYCSSSCVQKSRDGWTPERIERLKAMWAEGLSAAVIAGRLSRDAGRPISRSSVIGKIHRLGLSGRDKPARPSSPRPRAPRPRRQPVSLPGGSAVTVLTDRRQHNHRPDRPRAPVVPLPPPEPSVSLGEPVTLRDRKEYHCCWPIGEPAGLETLYCGARRTLQAPYCEYHARLMWRPARRCSERE